MSNHQNWKYGNLLLRISLGGFLALWGIDKLVASDDTVKIFSHFYKLPIGTSIVWIIGWLEILLGLSIGIGFKRKYSYLIGLIVHLISTVSSWKQLLDPWGKYLIDGKNSHLFLASIPVLATFIVLYFNREDGTYTLDARLEKNS